MMDLSSPGSSAAFGLLLDSILSVEDFSSFCSSATCLRSSSEGQQQLAAVLSILRKVRDITMTQLETKLA